MFLLVCLVIILADSLYYGDLTLWKLWELDMDWSDWKVTPVQFVLYNVVPGNLDKHGTHPHYLHALINIPLLFGPLGRYTIVLYCIVLDSSGNYYLNLFFYSGFCTHWAVANFYASVFGNRWGQKPSIRNASALAAFGFTVSLAALSVFPHQEPRFLLPLVVPCVLLGANGLRHRVGAYRPLLTLWYVFNVGAVLFFGLVHQAGVVPTVRWLGEGMELEESTSEVAVVFSKTYMPPRFPLLQAAHGTGHSGCLHNRPGVRFRFHDLSGAPAPEVGKKLTSLASRGDYLRGVKRIETLLVAPRHVARQVEADAGGALVLAPLRHSFPHLSVEAPPPTARVGDAVAELLARPAAAGMAELGRELFEALADFSLVVCRVEVAPGIKTVRVQTERANHS